MINCTMLAWCKPIMILIKKVVKEREKEKTLFYPFQLQKLNISVKASKAINL